MRCAQDSYIAFTFYKGLLMLFPRPACPRDLARSCSPWALPGCDLVPREPGHNKKRGCFSPPLYGVYISLPSGKRNRLIYSAPIAWAIFSRSQGFNPLRVNLCDRFCGLVPAPAAVSVSVFPAYDIAALTCLLVFILSPFLLIAIINQWFTPCQEKLKKLWNSLILLLTL